MIRSLRTSMRGMFHPQRLINLLIIALDGLRHRFWTSSLVSRSSFASRSVSRRTTPRRLNARLQRLVELEIASDRLLSPQRLQGCQWRPCQAHSRIPQVLGPVRVAVLNDHEWTLYLRLTRRYPLRVCRFDWLMGQGTISGPTFLSPVHFCSRYFPFLQDCM